MVHAAGYTAQHMNSAEVRFSQHDVEHLAALARLELSRGEVERYARELKGIVDYVAKLQELAPEALGASGTVASLRDDSVREWPEAEGLIAAAPDHTEHAVRVPPVFEDRV